MNIKRLKPKQIVIILALCLLVLTALYQHFTNKQDMLSLLQQVEPAAENYNEIEGSYKTYELIDGQGKLLNYAVIASASGYGGPITMLTTVNKNGMIDNAVILENSETPSYLDRVVGFGFPENLQRHSITEPFESNPKIDAVSGATITTVGLLDAVEKGMTDVGQNQLGLDLPEVNSLHFQWQDGLVIFILLAAFLAMYLKKKKLRPYLLVASVIVIGFMTKSSLTIGNFMSIVTNKMPVIIERPVWYIFVLGIIIVTILTGKNIYCAWVCPFGAVQEGLYKALNLTKTRVDQRIVASASKNRWFFIWLAAIVALYFNNPGIASYEPFSPFFGGEANTPQWILMGLVLVISILVFRFWCRFFCPVGAVLDFLAKVKRKGKQLFVRKRNVQSKPVTQESSCASCNSCGTNCGKKEKNTVRLNVFSKSIIVMIIVIDVLVIFTLLFNSGIK